jgi:hypothetical protein
VLLATAFLDSASTGTRWTIVAVTGVLTIGATVLFRSLSAQTTARGASSYDKFQRAGSAEQVRLAREAWGVNGLAAARKAWLLDLVYPVLYALFLATLASLCATHADSLGWGAFSTAMDKVSSFAIAAGAVDLLVENPAVGVGLWREPSDAAARLARAAGIIKWLLLGLVALGLVVAGVAFLVEKA